MNIFKGLKIIFKPEKMFVFEVRKCFINFPFD